MRLYYDICIGVGTFSSPVGGPIVGNNHESDDSENGVGE